MRVGTTRMPAIVRAECFVCRAPIEHPVINAFGSMAERVAVFVRLTDADGVSGWGEIWSNFPTVGAEHRARLFHTFIAPRLIGRGISDPASFWAETDRALHLWGLQAGEPGAFAAALSGADLALHDLAARRAGIPLVALARRRRCKPGAGLCQRPQSRCAGAGAGRGRARASSTGRSRSRSALARRAISRRCVRCSRG